MTYGRHRIQTSPNMKAVATAPLVLGNPLPSQTRTNAAQPPHLHAVATPRPRKPIGQILVEMGALTPADVERAAAVRQRENTRIGDILLARGMVDEATLYKAIGTQYQAIVADFHETPPDVRLIDEIGADECLKYGLLPWRRAGGATIIASCRPEEFNDLRARLTEIYGPVRLAISSETALHEALLRSRQRVLADAAETRVAASESCREIDIKRLTRTLSCMAVLALVFIGFFPQTAFIMLTLWAVLTLVVNSVLKVAAAFVQARDAGRPKPIMALRRKPATLPIVSVMVPLFRERAITAHLVKRLSRLDYPHELLDICLVVEEDDQVTQAAVATADLPRWMRQIIVPRGQVKTKPRALNFALDFCRGSIIGIWDAEDAPEPSQIHKVVSHFEMAAPDVACVQGVLDFYNARTNWLSRCFTVEYASWFRIVLPGYEKMGLVVPLGGTTLFFRRDAIEELGGWDAHNVTEDADLGIRLARHGYRTELISTVTEEEANCRAWPWIKQRSRWLKGYAMTWAVHMRSPRKLLRDLGLWRFFGVQALFLGTISQFILAPFLWSFWAVALGLPHPLRNVLPHEAFIALGVLFILSEVATVTVGMLATSTPKHKWLWPWVPTLHLYYPLATIATAKGLWEIVTRPYYWDKTAHGMSNEIAPFIPSPKAKATDKLPPLPTPAPTGPKTAENASVIRLCDPKILEPKTTTPAEVANEWLQPPTVAGLKPSNLSTAPHPKPQIKVADLGKKAALKRRKGRVDSPTRTHPASRGPKVDALADPPAPFAVEPARDATFVHQPRDPDSLYLPFLPHGRNSKIRNRMSLGWTRGRKH
ncbi:glycosyltransferase family 2 protein [Celeribacter sp.]|uniref:glycosyltransferase family 2 protein n=1 Tax=Celeribacter sp. TaxID=1890673 RepID=UPI003A8CB0A7